MTLFIYEIIKTKHMLFYILYQILYNQALRHQTHIQELYEIKLDGTTDASKKTSTSRFVAVTHRCMLNAFESTIEKNQKKN